MILASKSGDMCDVVLIRESRNAWFIEYPSEPGRQYRRPKDRYGMFQTTQQAKEWIYETH